MNVKEFSLEFLLKSLPRVFYVNGELHRLNIKLDDFGVVFCLLNSITFKESVVVQRILFKDALFCFLDELKNQNIYDYYQDVLENTLSWINSDDVVLKAANYAMFWHSEVNHLYDGKPYDVHLRLVAKYAKKYLYLLPENDGVNVLAACWLHDTIEDCRKTYNDVKLLFGETVADIVYALSNEKGKNRAERANHKYYSGIKATQYAAFCKICDRLANVEYSRSVGSSMLRKYKKENKDFTHHFKWAHTLQPMFQELESLFI